MLLPIHGGKISFLVSEKVKNYLRIYHYLPKKKKNEWALQNYQELPTEFSMLTLYRIRI